MSTLLIIAAVIGTTTTVAASDFNIENLVPFENKPVWGEGEDSGNVVFMIDKHFDSYKIRNERFLSFFYAPWCGHCKAMKPEFAKASLETDVPLVAMDCTSDGQSTCASYEVTGYPTIKYFDNGQAFDFGGARTKTGILKFLAKKDPNWSPEPFENVVPTEWNSTEGLVVHMTDDHFETYTKENERFLAFFYAPWCGHCKSSKDGYSVASTKFRRSMPFLAIDCTDEGAATCGKFKVTSYPDFKYFSRGGSPEDVKVSGDRSSGNFISFVEKKLDALSEEAAASGQYHKLRVKQLRKMLKSRGLQCRGCTEKKHFVEMIKKNIHTPVLEKKKNEKGMKNGKRRKTLMQEKREKILTAAAVKGWKDEKYGNGAVVHSHDGDFEENVLNGELGRVGFLGFFYAPWCGHCKAAKEYIVEVSEELEKAGVKQKIVAIDAEGSKEIALKFKIESFPTWHYFADSKVNDKVFDGSASEMLNGKKKLLQFMMKRHDSEWQPPPPPPFVNKPAWGEGKDMSGDVIFMTDDYFDKFMQEHPKGFLAMFFAPWCGHCKSLKPKYASASTKTKVPLVALDCTSDAMQTCQSYKVNGYPMLKWFSSDINEPEECNVRDEEGILHFITTKKNDKEAAPAAPPSMPAREKKVKKNEKNNKRLSKEDELSFLQAAKNGNIFKVKELLKKKKVQIETTSKDGYTALIYSSAKGHADIVAFLLTQGANKEATDNDGVNALDYAKKKRHESVVKLLEEEEEEEVDFEDVKEEL
jgi:thiol-disulfide isomerase/thioredoxin